MMEPMARSLITAICLLFAAHAAWAAADGRRVALVIGIGAYEHVLPLPNPVADAKAIAQALRRHGFDVAEHYDLSRADMLDVLEAFKGRASGASLAVVYYAGHGMEIEGKNILVPIDMEISCESRKTRRAVELEKLFEAVAGAPQQVVLLDACRNNPFPQCPTRAARAGSGFRGIGQIGVQDRSLLVANATLSGQLAADGDPGQHSPFADALLRRFQTDARTYLRDLLDMTAQDVRLASRGEQIPEVTSRGGAPRVCLSTEGCGASSASAAAAALTAADIAEARAMLATLGYLESTAAEGEAGLTDAVRRFQAKSGLPPDGKLTAVLVAVLRATERQVAMLPGLQTPGGGRQGLAPGAGIFTGPLEHEIGAAFKDCDVCPEMVVVPSGQFIMGSAPGDPGRQASEGPAHEVRIPKPFAIGKFEITFDDWEACALEGGCNGYQPKDSGWGRGRRPAIYISWDDAKAYVDWLGQRTGKAYRLPSEAEWELAARGGTTSPYATGALITTAQANFDASNAGGGRRPGAYEGTTIEVGSFPPNPFGLSDVHGNVAEWVEDCWNPSHAGAPDDGSPRGGDCKRRVLKGGAWYYERDYLRASSRMSYPKGVRLNVVGFRVARALD